MESKNIGSTFDSWLKKEGIHQQVSAEALQHVPTRRNFNGILSVARQLLDLHPADLGELLEMLAKGFPAASREQFLSRFGFPSQRRRDTCASRRHNWRGGVARNGSGPRNPSTYYAYPAARRQNSSGRAQRLARHADIRTTTQYGEVPMDNQRAANSQAVRPILERKSVRYSP